jgi:hypothetical protein
MVIVLSLFLFVALFERAHPDDGFQDFAPKIANAVHSGNSIFFVERAGISYVCGSVTFDVCGDKAPSETVRMVAGYAVHPITADEYSLELVTWFASARDYESDELGTGVPRLYATRCFQVSDESPQECVARATLLTSLQDTPRGLERSVRDMVWTKENGHWRIWWDTVASGSPSDPELRQLLDGTCRICLDWKLWDATK